VFDISFQELLLVFVVGLVVLGPQRLPVAIKTVMGWIRTIRGLAANVQNELAQELKLKELQESIKKAEALNLSALSPELSKTVEELKAQADKMKSELEAKAAEAGTTVEEQIKEIKNAPENGDKSKDAVVALDSSEILPKEENQLTDLTTLDAHEQAELTERLSDYYPPDDIEVIPVSKSQSKKTEL